VSEYLEVMLHQLLCHLLASFVITTGHDNSSSRCCQDSDCLGANTCSSSRSCHLLSLTHLSASNWEAHMMVIVNYCTLHYEYVACCNSNA